ncbi:formylglycine-generating enzyme family protein, partial [Psychrobacillus psychrotolerans]|uniref:formylglycine-generating enzyme family protein n=1 Tax=Psychrobacillus psychrotolerans TaxID=126156 RepID=UPI003C769A59
MNKENSCCSVNRNRQSIQTRENIVQDKEKLVKEIKFKEKMVYLSGGEFIMGTNDNEGSPEDGEGPARKMSVSPFYIDRHTVTN